MKNLKRTIYKVVGLVVTIAFAILPYAAPAYAAGGPYQPYIPHEPVDTGLGGGVFYALAGASFVGGFSILSTVKAIKEKLPETK